MRRVAVGPTTTLHVRPQGRRSAGNPLSRVWDQRLRAELPHSHVFCLFAAAMARQVFDSIPHSVRDVISWNSVISGYVQNGHYREALHLFGEMAGSSVAPDATTFVNALNACGRSGSAMTGRRIHARNTVCWTSMISGYAHAGQFKASVELFWEMQTARVKPDEAVVSSVISACGQLGALYHGRWVHAFCGTSGVGERLKVKNALIDMYSKCGDVERALQIFQDMLRPDVFSWTAIIGGLAMNGHSTMALDMFSQMEISGVGCAQWDHISRMFIRFLPTIRHYGCLVDLLGRGKLLGRWRTAERRAGRGGSQRVLELEHQKEHGAHVMLSNVYATAERWKEVNLAALPLRSMEPFTIFLVSESSHHQMDLIHETLLGLNELICSEGIFVSHSLTPLQILAV
ncbi:unnamed protein product [Spirodela intermedia]|uniref:Uncharacterized protein n=1 Tax=Spirodela intermedia TaxID=51605 RepID=A0A7I8IP19_SPIIN|nr:unnamed protein product [Spirodela intermedia]CAA6659646.1 unnamed protein product [Spirodela intermedia]